jgi:polysaccharide deacetylase family protein (PEP-CTERM system associated)
VREPFRQPRRQQPVPSAASDGEVIHALSFDIEDWFHLVEIPAVADPSGWDDLPSLVVDLTQWIVETLSSANVRATFFVLGWVAEKYPQIARLIADGGHELASHSYWHRRVDQLTPEEFAVDLRRSIDVLEQQSSEKVWGFRAPSFSITPGAEWALDILIDAGLDYDASLFPAARGHGGYPCPQEAHFFANTPSGRSILELPMSILQLGPVRLPFSGGGYMRLLPERMIRHGFDRFARRGRPVVVYLHPRDFAPHGPRVRMSLPRRFKCYVGLQSTKKKLLMLLERYRFDTCSAVLGRTAFHTLEGSGFRVPGSGLQVESPEAVVGGPGDLESSRIGQQS